MHEVTIGNARLICGDCMDVLPTLPKVDAVITDPPYHRVKLDDWDNQWATDDAFIAWAGEVCGLLLPLCSYNASLYWFASPQMAGRLEGVISERFHVLNNLVWDKSGGRKGVAGTGIDVTSLRGYWTANTERIIFAERYDSDSVASDAAGYDGACVSAKVNIFGSYLRAEFGRAEVGNKQIAALFLSKTGGMTGCVSNWLLGLNVPTSEQYEAMRQHLNARGDEYLRREYEDLRREYEDLRREYEDLRREYEDLRRPFYLTAADQWGDVWRFGLDREREHPTQKPIALMAHIVKASSRPGVVVLDPFLGSGTTGVAAVQQARRFIGIERNPLHFETACRRIDDAQRQAPLIPHEIFRPPEQMEIDRA